MSRWRTVLAVLALAGMLLLAYLRLLTGTPTEVSVKLFADLASALTYLGGIVAGKAAVEHLAAGGGIKGAVRALTSDAKPGEPAP